MSCAIDWLTSRRIVYPKEVSPQMSRNLTVQPRRLSVEVAVRTPSPSTSTKLPKRPSPKHPLSRSPLPHYVSDDEHDEDNDKYA